MRTRVLRRLGVLALVTAAGNLHGGGSGLNVAVVVNQNSADSVQLGNYYCERRGVPPQNLLRITNWTGGNVQWTSTDFTNYLPSPLLSMLASRQLTNQIEYVVLAMDFPYRVVQGGGASNAGTNSTTAALFYGFKADCCPSANPGSCSLPDASSNSYAGSEDIFRAVAQFSTNTNFFLVTMITSSNLAQAKAVVDRGVASDGSFPTQTVCLAKSTDVFRNIRYLLFDNAVFDTRLRGNCVVQRTNANTPAGLGYLLGFQGGWMNPSVPTNAFAPGALADSLTSGGGKIFEPNDHTTVLAFLNAGAAGSYGTVVEPCAYFEKFPTPQDYFFQARGFSLAECYYQSVTNPYQGLLVGEPLAAPFALPASGSWSNLPPDALLAGTTNLTVQFIASDADHPVQQVDLFLDGRWLQTLTNIAPRQNNKIYVAINGYATNYTVLTNATIKSVASNLTVVLNKSAYTNLTSVRAFTHGDRIQLQSFDLGTPGAQVSVSVSNAPGSATALTTFIAASRTSFLDTIACGLRGYLVTNAPLAGDWLQADIIKTNGTVTTIAVTNTPATNTISSLAKSLLDLINMNASLQSDDGVAGEDLIDYDFYYGQHKTEFNLRAQALGWPASQIQVRLAGSATFSITPAGTNKLDENLNDLQPRNHLYIIAGVTNLTLTFPFDTATQPDGYHELTVVAYEGSHVRTQARVAQNVRLQNTPLAATFTCMPCDSNTAVEATIQFSVVANTNNITRIELFSTVGSLGVVSNQSSAGFSVAGTNLDLGLHPFYALVTRNDGKQYRTETKWIRLVGAESAFPLGMAASPPVLAWPAVAGRNYDVLSADLVTNTFQLRDSVTPPTSAGQWTDTNAAPTQRYYRVRSSP